MPLRHVVLLRFHEDTSLARQVELEASFVALPAHVPEMAALECGTDVSPEGLSKGFTHCLSLNFAGSQDRDHCLTHAAQQAFVERLKPHLADVLIVDYFS